MKTSKLDVLDILDNGVHDSYGEAETSVTVLYDRLAEERWKKNYALNKKKGHLKAKTSKGRGPNWVDERLLEDENND